MVKYPHHFYYMNENSGGVSPSGHWTDNSHNQTGWQYAGECREEANGAGSKITLEDNTLYIFKSIIHLPLSSFTTNTHGAVKANMRIVVKDSDNSTERLIGRINRVVIGVKGVRIWV